MAKKNTATSKKTPRQQAPGAFNGSFSAKAAAIAALFTHARENRFEQNVGYARGRGCPTGAVIGEGDSKQLHERFARELHLPIWYGQLLDGIFDGVSSDKAPWFAIAAIELIPVG